MKLIAHRGNIRGPSPRENTVSHLLEALSMGYDVEVDVRTENGTAYFGHDSPSEPWYDFSDFPGMVWYHAKDLGAVRFLAEGGHHFFWQTDEPVSFTSRGYVWVNVGNGYFGPKTVQVMPELVNESINTSAYAVCSDYVDMM